MTTKGHTATPTAWVDLVSELSLVIGTRYTLQNVGPGKLKLTENATEPSIDEDIAHVIAPGNFIDIIPETAIEIWVISSSKNTQVVVTEA